MPRFFGQNKQAESIDIPVAEEPPLVTTEFSGEQIETGHPVGSREYFLQSPEVQKMVALSEQSGLYNQIRGVNIDDFEKKLEASPIDRRVKRALINAGLPRHAADASRAMAQLFSEPGRYPEGDVQARMALALRLMEPFRGKIPFLREEAIHMDIYRAAANLEPQLKTYRQNSQTLTDRFKWQLAPDPPARYELAKLVAEDGTNGHGQNDMYPEDKNSISWLVKLLSGPYQNGDSLLISIIQEIKDGSFNRLIAHDILQMSETNLAIQNLVRFAGHLSAAESDDDALNRLAESADFWPKEAQAALREQQEALTDSMRSAIEKARADLEAKLGLVSNGMSSEERFNSAMGEVVESAHKVNRSATGGRASQIPKKQLSGIGGSAVSASATRPAPSPEIIREVDNGLRFVDRQGNVYEERSEKFRDMVEEFLGKYKGTPGLAEDIETAFKHLRSLDLRNPTSRSGVESMKAGQWHIDTDNGLQERPLFRFKAQEAAGFPLKTQVIRRHRIIFTTVDNDTVGIVAIVDRAKLNDFTKRL